MGDSKKDESTEQRILQVAKTVFFKKGYAGARMQDIADEAGINKAMLHYYFRSKDRLFEMIFAEAVSRFLPKVQLIMNLEAPLLEKIEKFVREYITILSENPFIPMFILNELHKNPKEFFDKFFWEKMKLPVKKFADQIALSVKDKLIKPTEPFHLLINIMSLCIFPFVARPLYQMLSGLSNKQYEKFLDQRKTEVVSFIIEAIKI